MNQQPQPARYESVPMTGVVDTRVPLVHASAVNNVTQVFGAVVGGIGFALVGAGIAPLITSETVPVDALRGVAKACAELGDPDAVKCARLISLPTSHLGATIVTLIIGGLLIAAQVFLVAFQVWPRRQPE